MIPPGQRSSRIMWPEMRYALLDEQFYDHPKVLALLEHEDGLAAVGLWTLCLGWARSHADPFQPELAGRIPAFLPRRVGGTSELAKLLVAVGLWRATEDGWVIHDFAQWQDLEGWAKRTLKAAKAAEARWSDHTDPLLGHSDENMLGASTLSENDENTLMPGALPISVHITSPPTVVGEELRSSLSSRPAINAHKARWVGWAVTQGVPKTVAEAVSKKHLADLADGKLDVDQVTRIAASMTDDPGTRADVDGLCEHLADRIEQQLGKRPKIGRHWRRAARLLIDIDGHSEEQIHRAIDWCQDDEFWRANILSMTRLRAKYVQLRAAATRQQRGRSRQPAEAGEWDLWNATSKKSWMTYWLSSTA